MKVFYLIVISFSVALCSCKTTAQSNHRKNSCDTVALKKAIEQNWKYNAEYNYYSTNDSFINKLNTVYRDCFYGSDTSLVTRYFGRNFVDFSVYRGAYNSGDTLTAYLKFYISRPCETFVKQGFYECYWLNFFMDKNSELILIRKEWTHMSLQN